MNLQLRSLIVLVILVLMNPITAAANTCAKDLLDLINYRYLRVHEDKEERFWEMRMALPGYVEKSFEAAESRYKTFVSDPMFLTDIRTQLAATDLSHEVRSGLDDWRRFFEVNAIEKPAALEIQRGILDQEGDIQSKISRHPWTYLEGNPGSVTPVTPSRLRSRVSNASSESERRSAYEGMLSIEQFVVDNGLIALVNSRNRFARELGFKNFLEYRLSVTEGITVASLFTVLDDLERNTREAGKRCVDSVVAEHGPDVVRPWNFDHYGGGDLRVRRDPYFRYSSSLGRWGETAARMGTQFRGAKMRLDLLDRPKKYANGFMHATVPPLMRDGVFHPSEFGTASNSNPEDVGAGESAMKTLLHEMDHIAHMANPELFAFAFAQEHPPTSMAFAELHSMFMDSFLLDPEWLATYATSQSGAPMPEELIVETALNSHRFMARNLRASLVMPYFERALYEAEESELNPAFLIRLARRIERDLVMTPGATLPVMTFVHLLSGEAAGTYSGYVRAALGVSQTRKALKKRHGYLVDNYQIGFERREKYWKHGNVLTFDQNIFNMTGEKFSSDATIERVNRTSEEVERETRATIAAARARLKIRPAMTIRIDAQIKIVHGDEVIATYEPNGDFAPFARQFAAWIDGPR